MKCPNCKAEIPLSLLAAAMGKQTSPRKKKSSRENGKLGGRPRKDKGKKR